MSQLNPIRVFVTHAWEESDDYQRIFEYLESARNFYYRNTSAPDKAPSGGTEPAREELRRQINAAEVVVALASLGTTHLDLLTFQLNYAKASKKPILGIKFFGVQSPVAQILGERVDDLVDWDERGLTDGIRRLARHENTARYDTIEFKLDDD
jgi:hypothetical protein